MFCGPIASETLSKISSAYEVLRLIVGMPRMSQLIVANGLMLFLIDLRYPGFFLEFCLLV
jgi:hypothetical protein